MAIDKFVGRYKFLSNFFPCVVELHGESYPSAEHAFQAAKTTDAGLRARVQRAPLASQAKKLGRQLPLRPDWEAVKGGVMEAVLRSKFSDANLRTQLLATGEEDLVEGNDWGDREWGVCDGVGENKLGLTLQKVRAELREARRAGEAATQARRAQ